MAKYNKIIIVDKSPVNGYYAIGKIDAGLTAQMKRVVDSCVSMVTVPIKGADGQLVDTQVPRSNIKIVRVDSIDEENGLARVRLAINLTKIFGAPFKVEATDTNKEGNVVARLIQTFAFPTGDVFADPELNTMTPGTFEQIKVMFRNQQIVEEYFKTPGAVLIDGSNNTYTSPYFEGGQFRNVGAETAVSMGFKDKGYEASVGSIQLTLVENGSLIMALAQAVNPATKRGFVAVIPECGKEGEYQDVYGFVAQGLTGFGAGGGVGTAKVKGAGWATPAVKPKAPNNSKEEEGLLDLNSEELDLEEAF
jgi:hypothetical protein